MIIIASHAISIMSADQFKQQVQENNAIHLNGTSFYDEFQRIDAAMKKSLLLEIEVEIAREKAIYIMTYLSRVGHITTYDFCMMKMTIAPRIHESERHKIWLRKICIWETSEDNEFDDNANRWSCNQPVMKIDTFNAQTIMIYNKFEYYQCLIR